MSAQKTTRSFANVAIVGLIIAATTNTSSARFGPHGPRPACGGDCQANKAVPAATVANGKTSGSVGGPNAGGKNYQQQ
jgi:hypothetical protein